MERNDIYFMDEFDKQFSSALLPSFYDASLILTDRTSVDRSVGPLIMYCWYPRTFLTMYLFVTFF